MAAGQYWDISSGLGLSLFPIRASLFHVGKERLPFDSMPGVGLLGNTLGLVWVGTRWEMVGLYVYDLIWPYLQFWLQDPFSGQRYPV